MRGFALKLVSKPSGPRDSTGNLDVLLVANRILKWSLGILVGWSALLCPVNARANDDAVGPNIVLIVADDLGYGDLSCYGQADFETAHIDRLAAEGMKFTQFYAGSTVCSPSRCVLMTGLHTGHCYIRGNARMSLRPGDVTIAEVLQDAGYVTGLFGKWGLGEEGTTGVPTKQGFDEFFGYLNQRHAHNYYPGYLIAGEERFPLKNVVPNQDKYGGGVSTNKAQYSPDLILDRTLGFLDRHHDEPFFLYYATTLIHANNEADENGMEIPDLGRFAKKDWPAPQKGHAAMAERLDADVGKIVAKLAEHGITENTLLIFTSDNGPHNEGGNRAAFFNSNGPLRGIKRDPYDGGIRVPMIAYWPGTIQANSVTNHLGYLGDFFATFADLADASVPGKLDSISLVPVFRSAENPPEHGFLYWEFYERGSFQALRMGPWKVIVRPIGGSEVELYNVVQDIDESEDVAKEHPDVIARALKIMARERVPSAEFKPPKKTKKKRR